MRKVTIFGILGFITLAILLVLSKFFPSDVQYKTVRISSVTIRAEVADTELKRNIGLMARQNLPSNEGMLFIFGNEGYPGIWMMNMSFPIDIVWIGKDYKITSIVEGAVPCENTCPVHYPQNKSMYVLEVTSGFVAKNKIKVGDNVRIS
ncbi:MAG: DUF192 domain-containing protein [Candidatus Aenigmarchaeota archaeon]|nr:DUF192 domain-containing protein [Candidatus Aenigmarchaeota archaeon]